MTYEQIIGEKEPYPGVISGIYFLILEEQIVYVGQSYDVVSRISTHRKQGKIEFDSIKVEPCARGEMNDREADYIVHFAPINNETIPTNGIWISLNQIKRRSGLTKPRLKRGFKSRGILPTNGYYRMSDLEEIL